ncbi:MAG TPA: RNA polymerase sigma factor [Actinomycetota bacterium]
MRSEPTDADLVRASLSDPVAFEAVFDRHFVPVYGYCVRRIGAEAGEDVAALTFLRAFRARGRFRMETSDARPWLLGIAGNLIREHRRAERRHLRLLAKVGRQPVETVPDPSISTEARTQLAAALLRLSRADRESLLLHVWGGLSYEEIAAATGVPLGTVRSRIHRARRRVRELLAVSGQYPDDELDFVEGERGHG